MKKFNPEKELRKIEKGNRNKIIVGICVLLLMIAVGSTYALYQVRYTNKLLYTVVAPFSNKDINLAVYVDGNWQNNVPEKGTAYYDGIVCDSDIHASAKWDYDNWKLTEFEVTVPNKCRINFTKKYRDKSGANPPELYQGLIPVIIDDDGTIKVANTDSEWYNYGEHKWANAVLVTTEKYNELTQDKQIKEDKIGTTLNLETDILQMYVWIPRYKYQLFNAKSGSNSNPQMINIEFENGISTTGTVKCITASNGKETCENDENGNWYTHPAFSFGDNSDNSKNKQLAGFWIGKFESSGTIDNLTIKPNVGSLREIDLNTMFNASRNVEEKYANNFNLIKEEIDTHMMKNMEWGALSYLSSSKYGRYINKDKCTDGGCQIWLNNVSTYTTGCSSTPSNSGGTPFIETTAPSCNATTSWNGTYGRHASTTDNITGVYDMNGGVWEFVPGNSVDINGNYQISLSNLLQPQKRYYDIYEYGINCTEHARGHLGDATREILTTFGNDAGSWFGDRAEIPDNTYPWFVYGGEFSTNTESGAFSFGRNNGREWFYAGFRLSITKSAD